MAKRRRPIAGGRDPARGVGWKVLVIAWCFLVRSVLHAGPTLDGARGRELVSTHRGRLAPTRPAPPNIHGAERYGGPEALRSSKQINDPCTSTLTIQRRDPVVDDALAQTMRPGRNRDEKIIAAHLRRPFAAVSRRDVDLSYLCGSAGMDRKLPVPRY